MRKSPLQPTLAATSDLKDSVAREQMSMILAHTEVGILAATAFAVLLALGLHSGAIPSDVPHQVVPYWVGFKLVIVALRLVAARLSRNADAAVAKIAGDLTLPLLAIDGLIWGVGAASLMSGPTDKWSLIAACIVSVACVATFGLQARVAATGAYVIPMLAPTSVALLRHGGPAAYTAGTGIALLLLLLLSTARRSELRLAELIYLRLDTERVSGERASALALAERHSKAKDRFLGVVSHELRTPLHGILGLTRLTRNDMPKTAASALMHYRLEMIENAGAHLQRMVNDLLDISFMESGRLDLKPAPYNLQHELSLIAATYSAQADEGGIGFHVNFHPNLCGFVLGDSGRVAQILHNLLGNAFKFTPLGGSVSLIAERIEDSPNVRFSVRDTGPGVLPEERESIFEIFTQGNVAGSRPGGVGLGLAISRQLARAMNGDVDCDAGAGRGATFTFTAALPLTKARPAPIFTTPASPKSEYAGLTILIADDDQLNALVNASVIRALGCQVEMFENGQALVDHVLKIGAEERPAAILLDWDMPILDGGATTLALRRHERRAGLAPVPIIGLSASASAALSAAARAAGMDTFLTKPCTPDDLSATLTGLIRRGSTSTDKRLWETRTGWVADS